MSAFGKGEEIKEGSAVKLYTGVENFRVVAVNPSKEEMEKMYDRELNFTPEYVGTTKVTDSDGEREVNQIRLDFFLANEDNSITTKVQFYVADTHHRSASGKYKCINSFGRDIWLEKDAVQTKTLPDNLSWYNADGVKVAKRGETEMISFLVNLLNLPFNLDKVSDVSEAYARIDKAEWAKIIGGDVTLLRNIVAGTNNKVGILLGVKTTGEGKLRQTALNKHTLRQFTLSSTKPAKYKYILKDLDDAKANGALGNVDFGPRSLILGEHQLEATVISDENTNQTDIFATAETPTGSDMEDDQDWLGED
tara:strand:+ start:163 stop:1086 length:924 start_codon:yes stop_codon:yes gene_type:complete